MLFPSFIFFFSCLFSLLWIYFFLFLFNPFVSLKNCLSYSNFLEILITSFFLHYKKRKFFFPSLSIFLILCIFSFFFFFFSFFRTFNFLLDNSLLFLFLLWFHSFIFWLFCSVSLSSVYAIILPLKQKSYLLPFSPPAFSYSLFSPSTKQPSFSFLFSISFSLLTFLYMPLSFFYSFHCFPTIFFSSLSQFSATPHALSELSCLSQLLPDPWIFDSIWSESINQHLNTYITNDVFDFKHTKTPTFDLPSYFFPSLPSPFYLHSSLCPSVRTLVVWTGKSDGVCLSRYWRWGWHWWLFR